MKKISLRHLYKKACIAYQKSKRFVIFREPKSKKLQLYIHNPKIKGLKKCFLISTLNHEKKIYIYPDKVFYAKLQESFIHNNLYFSNSFGEIQEEYLKIIQKALLELKSEQLQKIVLSRIKKISLEKKIFIKKSFQNLIVNYPNAFTYLWYDTKYGIWIGATPELLLKSEGNQFQTVALAGTIKVNQNETQWDIKEIEEHYIVIEYIKNILKNYHANIFIHNTKSYILGHIKHLKTLINFSFRKQTNINNFIKDLHPTPAICGFPKNIALEFIRDNECHPRDFYTGYLGILNKGNISLYVNLRCAKIYKKEITLYAGSGIMAKSIPNKEWIETELKIENILSQLVFTSSLI